jgi:hypothetical protein
MVSNCLRIILLLLTFSLIGSSCSWGISDDSSGGAWPPPSSPDGNWKNSSELVGVSWESNGPWADDEFGADSPGATGGFSSPSWPPSLGWSPWTWTEGPSLVAVSPLVLEDLGSGDKLIDLEPMVESCRISLGERFEDGGVVVGNE